MAKLEAKLKLKREKRQDPVNPSNWLSIAKQSELEEIKKFIFPRELPEEYELFLKQYSPIQCCFRIKGVGTIDIYSTNNLIDSQQGYSFNGNEKLSDWPESYLVIADSDADPFCIDLSKNNSPVYFAYHGSGNWEFSECHPDFFSFIKSLAV